MRGTRLDDACDGQGRSDDKCLTVLPLVPLCLMGRAERSSLGAFQEMAMGP